MWIRPEQSKVPWILKRIILVKWGGPVRELTKKAIINSVHVEKLFISNFQEVLLHLTQMRKLSSTIYFPFNRAPLLWFGRNNNWQIFNVCWWSSHCWNMHMWTLCLLFFESENSYMRGTSGLHYISTAQVTRPSFPAQDPGIYLG